MSDDENDPFWPPPYDVGYKKPPKSQRFVKGKSGNPRGRPPKKKPLPEPLVDKSTMESILTVSRRKVTVRDGDTSAKLTTIDVVLQTMAVTAMKGSVPAQKAFVELVYRARKDQATEIQNDHTAWRNYVATYNECVETFHKARKPLPEDMPHPDDLVFEEGEFVMLKGGDPIIAAQNRNLMTRFRDVLMLQAEKDRRTFWKENPKQPLPIFVSEYFATHINACLPKRMQLDDAHLLFRISRIETMRDWPPRSGPVRMLV
ncbi:hypothetical protein OCA4_c29310 [Afipia carboxidovorans OM4]|uniref:DUF5681 domain-containing protein n=1 Tax=Afipia carboxidovorans TaxID=40137 RepID=UPI000212ACB2|nr:DUF5681 domain-containing protein [Afipia carboxidovorans]AEI04040.1 hypothetical protein OCA4_c29310 [Afipia carboxidovorans OM4]